MIALDFSHVSLQRGARRVLNDISFSIAAGSFVGLLGTNGAGKTTLMQAALGLVPCQSGTITLMGEAVRRGNPRVGYLPQARNLGGQGRISARDLLFSAYHGEHWGFTRDRAAADAAIAEALELVGATALAGRAMNSLSGGERQRVLIGQCLMRRPDILLLDEPLISLDPARVQDMINLVRSLQQRLKLTVLFSAHDVNPLLGALDQVLYLGQGRAVLGRVEDVITGPVLSELYQAPIEVVPVNGRLFVMTGGQRLDPEQCHGHDHAAAHPHEHEARGPQAGHGHGFG